MFVSNVHQISLNPRPNYRDLILAGSPEAFGRIVSMSEDRRLAYLIWRGTPGTYGFKPDPVTTDTCVVMSGKAIVRQASSSVTISAGTLFQFPQKPFEFQIVEEFLKVSVLYNPNGLQCNVEPI